MPLRRPEPLWLPKMRAFVSAKHLMDSVIRKCNTCNLTNQGQRAELIGLITELQISLRDLSGAYPDELCRIMVEFKGTDNKKDNHPDVGIWRDFSDAYADEIHNSYMMSERDERCPRFDLTEYTTPKQSLYEAANYIAKEHLQDIDFRSVAEQLASEDFTKDELAEIHRLAITAHPTIN